MGLVKRLALAGLLMVVTASTAWAAQPGEPVGRVVRIQGTAVALLDAVPRPLTVGADVRLGEVLSTGPDARLEVEIQDGSTLFLGEQASLNLEFFDEPATGGEMVMRLLTGAFSAVSGRIAQAGGRMEVHTPVATIGIRGTTVWGGIIDGNFQVALLDGARAVVTTRAGRVDLVKVGDGTLIKDPDSVPTPPNKWGGDKLERAKATVAFR
ncbi:hypothetical protein JCM17960_03400 [Magnetospira thiophila]